MKDIVETKYSIKAGIIVCMLALGLLMLFLMSFSQVSANPPTGVSAIDVENSTFSPNADTIKDNASINVTADTGQTLYINIYNSTWDLQYQGLPLIEDPGIGWYYGSWNGTESTTWTVVVDGQYTLNVTSSNDGNASNESAFTQTVSVDTLAPTVSVTITQESAQAGIGEWINITVTTDVDVMSVDADLAIAGFTGQVDDQALMWSGTIWFYNFTVAAGTFEGSNTINVDAVDDAGNSNNNNTESATWDEVVPTVVLVIVSDLLLSDNDLGFVFNVTITFSEPMDMGVTPVIVFENPDLVATLTLSTSDWISSTEFRQYYTFTDDNEEAKDIDINVTAGQDVAGNVMVYNVTVDVFEVDTLNPWGGVVPSGSSITEADVGGMFWLNWTFIDNMDNTSLQWAPGPDVVSSGTLIPIDEVWNADNTMVNMSFTIGDADEEIPIVSIWLLDSEDDAGNFMDMPYQLLFAFSVDTLSPTVNVTITQESPQAGIGEWINITVETDADVVSVDADLATAGFAGQVNDQALTWSGTEWFYNFTVAAGVFDGMSTINVDAVDSVGNTDFNNTESATWDEVAPTVMVTITQESTPAGIGEWINITVNTDADVVAVDADLAAAGFTGQVDDQALMWSGTVWFYNFTVVAGSFDGSSTINVDAVDDAGNMGNNNTESATWDEVAPTVSVMVSHSFITDGDAGSTFYLNCSFSENMDAMTLPLITFSPDVEGSGTLIFSLAFWNANFDWYNVTYTIADIGEEQIAVDISVSGTNDDAGNALSPDPTISVDAFDVDTLNPTVTIFISHILITDDDAGSTFYLNCSFSENMDAMTLPLITFNPDVEGSGTLIFSLAFWNANFDWYNVTYTIADVGEEQIGVDINVSGTQDDAGNALSPDPTTSVDAFDVDTIAPSVISAIASAPLISEAVGWPFYVTITFSEPMNMGVTPVIVFENPGLIGTLTPSTSNWISSTEFRQNYTLTDDDEESPDIDINITVGQDVAGNAMSYDVTLDVFDVDTLNPSASVDVSDWLITEADVGGTFWVNFSFTDNMDNTSMYVEFTPDVVSSETLILIDAVWNANNNWWNISYMINDTNEGWSDVSIWLFDARDDVGNLQIPNPFQELVPFSVDTLSPTLIVTIIQESPQAGIGQWINITVTADADVVSVDADLAAAGFAGQADDQALMWSGTEWFYNFTIMAGVFDGTNIINVDAADLAGNTGNNNTENATWDEVAPTVNVMVAQESYPAGVGEWVNITVNTDMDAVSVVGDISAFADQSASEIFLWSGTDWYYNFTIAFGTLDGIGTINVTATDDAGNEGYNDTESAEVNETLTLDYILITDAPGGTELGTVTLPIGGTVTAYASGYNYTGPTYIGLIEVDWSEMGGMWAPTPANTSTFTAGLTSGTYTQTGANSTLGVSDTFDVFIQLAPDYILITNVPDGIELTSVTMPVGGLITFYASAYNATGGDVYVGLVDVNWSAIPLIGLFDNLTGTSTTFIAGIVDGSTNITGQNTTLGVSDNFTINILPPTLDYINVTESPNGTPLVTVPLQFGGSFTAYASGYNTTGALYMGLVEVDWFGVGGTWSNATGNSSTFTGGVIGGIYTQTAWNGILGVSDTFDVNISNICGADYIIITDAPDGNELTTVTLPIGGTVTAYASGYNLTSGAYLGLYDVNWSGLGGGWAPVTGVNSTFTAGIVGGFYPQTAENISISLSDTFNVDILPPTVDYIMITDTPNGSELTTVNINIGEQVEAFASGYNYTGPTYVGLVEVNWSAFPDLGTFNNDTGTSTIFTAGYAGGAPSIIGDNATSGLNDAFSIIIAPPTVDYIRITATPNGTDIVNVILDIGEQVEAFASGYNNTDSFFIGLVNVDWTDMPDLGTFNNDTGTSTIFTAGYAGGMTTITANLTADPQIGDYFTVDINPPTVDYILITDAPDGTELITVIISVVDSVEAYASGYNNTNDTYVGLVDVDWSADPLGLGTFSNLTGTSTIFNASGIAGTATITGQNTIMTPPVSDFFTVEIQDLTVDYINITGAPNGTELTTVTLPIGGSITAYASGYNTTAGMFVGLVVVDWSQNPTLGLFNNLTGNSTTFTAGFVGGSTLITAQNMTMPYLNDTFTINILPPTLDYINITDAPNGTTLMIVTLPVGANVTVYASGYNNTGPTYVGLIDVNWSDLPDLGSFDNLTGTSTMFIAGLTGGLTMIYGENVTMPWINDSFEVDILPPTVDRIEITNITYDELLDSTVDVGYNVTGYAALFNSTSGFISAIDANWTAVGLGGAMPLIGPTPGVMSWINVGINEGTVWWNVSYFDGTDWFNDTVVYTVNPPTVDYLDITDMPGGTPIDDATVDIGFRVWGNASLYNYTAGFLYTISANWTNESVDGAIPFGGPSSAVFTWVDVGLEGGNVTWNASYYDEVGKNWFNDTVTFTVNPPEIDYIIITDSPDGTELTTEPIDIGQSVTAYASGYNSSVSLFIDLVDVDWSLSQSLGTLDIATGNSTTFTAGLTGGSLTVIGENLNLGLSDTFTIDITPPTVDYVNITDAPDGAVMTSEEIFTNGNITAYASGYNSTGDIYVGLVEVAWSDTSNLGDFDNNTGTNTIFTAGATGGTTTIRGQNSTLGISGEFTLNVIEPTTDYILITDTAGGTEIQNRNVPVRFEILGTASAYNNTVGYITPVSVTWTVTNTDGAEATTSDGSGTTETFIAGSAGGTATWTADYGGITDTVVFTILPPTVDYIFIVDENDDALVMLILGAGESYTVYAMGYNYSLILVGPIGHVSVEWSVDGGATVTPTSGDSTTIKAGDKGGTFTVTATHPEGGSASLVLEVKGKPEEGFPMILMIVPIIIAVVVLLLLFLLLKRKKKEEVPEEVEAVEVVGEGMEEDEEGLEGWVVDEGEEEEEVIEIGEGEDAEFECPDCGAILTPDMTECPGCGLEFEVIEEEEEEGEEGEEEEETFEDEFEEEEEEEEGEGEEEDEY